MRDDIPKLPELTRDRCQGIPIAPAGRRLLAETVADCNSSEATLWVFSADGTHLEAALNHGPTKGIVEALSVPIAGSVVGMVASTGIASAIGPGDSHNPEIDAKTGTPTRFMAAAPVHRGSILSGVLSTINPKDGGSFSGKQLEILAWKAYLLGLILADAREG